MNPSSLPSRNDDDDDKVDRCDTDSKLGNLSIGNGHAVIPVQTTKRKDFLDWDEFFMGTALLAAQRSKDPSTQVGAVIVNSLKIVIGIGYNGFPRGCDDDELPWSKNSDNPLHNKYLFVCHAEMNAIINRNLMADVNSTIYTTLFPCAECCKMIIQSGIKHVVYLKDKPEKPEMKASRIMFSKANLDVRKFVPKRDSITLNFN